MLVTRSMVRKALEDRGDLSDGHESGKSLEVYSTLAITDAQYEYNEVINKLLLCGLFKTQWRVSDAMGMKNLTQYLGERANWVRIASGQEPQNK